MQQHATAAQFEYLPPGGEQAKFDFPKPGKRVHSVYDAVAKEAGRRNRVCEWCAIQLDLSFSGSWMMIRFSFHPFCYVHRS